MQQWIRRTITITISETWTWNCDPSAETTVAGISDHRCRVIQIIHRQVTLPAEVVIIPIETKPTQVNPTEKERSP